MSIEARLKRECAFQLAEEVALAMAQATISQAMRAARLSRSSLARRLGVSRAAVTNLLSDGHGMTVRTFARYLEACGFEARFKLVKVTPPRTSTPGGGG